MDGVGINACSIIVRIGAITSHVEYEYSKSLNAFIFPSPTPSHMEQVL